MQTPLHVACGRSDDHAIATTIADMLIEAGADVNNGVGDKDGYQPMHMGKILNTCYIYPIS
jgi:ankyrin repeat protein